MTHIIGRNVVKLNNKSFIASLCALWNIQGILNFQEFSAQYIATTYAKSTQQTYIYYVLYFSYNKVINIIHYVHLNNSTNKT